MVCTYYIYTLNTHILYTQHVCTYTTLAPWKYQLEHSCVVAPHDEETNDWARCTDHLRFCVIIHNLSMNQIWRSIALQDRQSCFNVCPVDIAEAINACTAKQGNLYITSLDRSVYLQQLANQVQTVQAISSQLMQPHDTMLQALWGSLGSHVNLQVGTLAFWYQQC